MSDQKIKVSWGMPVLPGPKPGESVEDRPRREAEDEAWLEKMRALTRKAVHDLRRETR